MVVAHIPLRGGDDEVSTAVLDQVTDRTRLAIIDQVTSPTARRMPLVSLLPALQERGTAVFVDGAHAPGMLAVELDRLGADFWAGNLHKWCCAPLGTAVLHVASQHRPKVRPLVAGWGEAAGFPEAFNEVGSEDLTAWLAAPRALRLLGELGFERLRRHNVELAVHGQRVLAEGLGLDAADLPRDPAVSMQPPRRCQQVMNIAQLAASSCATARDRRGGGCHPLDGSRPGSLSAHVYNSPADYVRLANDLPALL